METTDREPQSYFARKLAENPVMAARYEQIARELRQAADEDLRAVVESEILTAEDFSVVINARADELFSVTEEPSQ